MRPKPRWMLLANSSASDSGSETAIATLHSDSDMQRRGTVWQRQSVGMRLSCHSGPDRSLSASCQSRRARLRHSSLFLTPFSNFTTRPADKFGVIINPPTGWLNKSGERPILNRGRNDAPFCGVWREGSPEPEDENTIKSLRRSHVIAF